MNLFSNSTLQLSFNQIDSISLSKAFGFAMFTPSNSYYYVSDLGLNRIFILNEDWSYVSNKTFLAPAYLTTIGNNLYATGYKNIWKLDQNLNILIQYTATGFSTSPGPYYMGIYYNSTNNLIYVAPNSLNVIEVFNLNLNLNHTFSISPNQPWSIAGYNNQMYIGANQGKILVLVNEVIIRTFNGCNGNSAVLSSVLFDSCGYMAITCYNYNQLYLYDPNGTYLSKNKVTPTLPT